MKSSQPGHIHTETHTWSSFERNKMKECGRDRKKKGERQRERERERGR